MTDLITNCDKVESILEKTFHSKVSLSFVEKGVLTLFLDEASS